MGKKNNKFLIFGILITSMLLTATLHATNIQNIRFFSEPRLSQLIGNPVSFLPKANSTTTLEFQYKIISPNDTNIYIARDWSTNINWLWDTTGLQPGKYHFQLRARHIGSTAPYDIITYKNYTLVNNPPVSSILLSSSAQSPQDFGAPIILTATSTPQTGIEYRFLVKAPNTSKAVMTRDWGGNSWTWPTANLTAGKYKLVVQARTLLNNVLTYEADTRQDFILTANQTINTLTVKRANMSSPQTVGVSVNFEATANPSANIEYRFMVRPEGRKSPRVARDWSTSPAWTWNTAGLTPGIYIFEVRARIIGSTTQYDKKVTTGFNIVGLEFQDVAASAGVYRLGESWGGAWGDVNGDGLTDMWVTNHRTKPALYINNGNGTFTNRVNELLINTATTDSHGTAWADFDNDGDQDLVQTAGGGQGIRAVKPGHFNFLYINQNGTLIDDAVARGVSYELARGRGATWLDWNNDGFLDLFYTTQRSGNDPSNVLFLQQADGTFLDASTSIGIPTKDGGTFSIFSGNAFSTTSSLFVGSNRFPKQIYQGVQGATTVTVDPPSKFSSSSDAAIGDFNNDLISDIFVARSAFERQLYTLKNPNRLDFLLGTFQSGREVGLIITSGRSLTFELTVAAQQMPGVYIGNSGLNPDSFTYTPIKGKSTFRVTLSADDARTSGMMDRTLAPYGIFIGYDQTTSQWTILTYNTSALAYSTVFGKITSPDVINSVKELNFETPVKHPADTLLTGTADGRLVEESNTGFEFATPSISTVVGDFDNDMDLDIYTLQSTRIANKPNILYINTGNGKFVKIPSAAGAEGTLSGAGDTVIMSDYDSDGFLDLMTFNGKAEPPFNDGPNQLFKNMGNSNNWLEIDLQGVMSNRDGIGAIIYLKTPDGKTQLREQNGQVHNKGQNDKRLHFGMKKNATARITIKWPSGIIQQVGPVAANQIIKILEQ